MDGGGLDPDSVIYHGLRAVVPRLEAVVNWELSRLITGRTSTYSVHGITSSVTPMVPVTAFFSNMYEYMLCGDGDFVHRLVEGMRLGRDRWAAELRGASGVELDSSSRNVYLVRHYQQLFDTLFAAYKVERYGSDVESHGIFLGMKLVIDHETKGLGLVEAPPVLIETCLSGAPYAGLFDPLVKAPVFAGTQATRSIHVYQAAFRMLWMVKCAEYAVSNTWRQAVVSLVSLHQSPAKRGKAEPRGGATEITSLVRVINNVRAKLLAFVTAIRSYFTYFVLDTQWKAFKDRVQLTLGSPRSSNSRSNPTGHSSVVAQLVSAHAEFMVGIAGGLLQSESHASLRSVLDQALLACFAFTTAHGELCDVVENAQQMGVALDSMQAASWRARFAEVAEHFNANVHILVERFGNEQLVRSVCPAASTSSSEKAKTRGQHLGSKRLTELERGCCELAALIWQHGTPGGAPAGAQAQFVRGSERRQPSPNVGDVSSGSTSPSSEGGNFPSVDEKSAHSQSAAEMLQESPSESVPSVELMRGGRLSDAEVPVSTRQFSSIGSEVEAGGRRSSRLEDMRHANANREALRSRASASTATSSRTSSLHSTPASSPRGRGSDFSADEREWDAPGPRAKPSKPLCGAITKRGTTCTRHKPCPFHR